jgi:signal transduction histidine kinase
VHVNPACDAVLGTSLRPVADLDDYPDYGGGLHPDGRPYAPEDYPIARAAVHGEVVRQELTRYRRGDGRVVTVSISAAPVCAADGRIAYAVAAVEDVSAHEAARAAAQAANRAKSEFLATMSHELRTPLNAIGGYAELIELGIHGPVTDAQRAALARIQQSQRHLLGLIAGVLDYSRVEAGAVTYRVVDVPVAEAVAEAEALVAPQLRAKGLGYAWSGAPPELAVRADREKLQQILLNLLGNAIKFTDPRGDAPGRIEVACAVHEDAAGRHVQLHVRDTGEGIAPEQLERVFEPFVQADQRLTRPHAGVGLGLAISRDLARGMGGELTVESTLGQGSTFTLTLPRA